MTPLNFFLDFHNVSFTSDPFPVSYQCPVSPEVLSEQRPSLQTPLAFQRKGFVRVPDEPALDG